MNIELTGDQVQEIVRLDLMRTIGYLLDDGLSCIDEFETLFAMMAALSYYSKPSEMKEFRERVSSKLSSLIGEYND